ncbi:unnamed protein product [Notodromas monacha]|uniref:Uncharacterized protein n=1 Tax=Notodromas monacha TaxID=399045 RepID=A0A7R9GE87_9CRUS|nr:unnamed protein product [Notodromas monacha]CAG0919359.1 unnamed protein product [Notodromas monacha]
MKATNLNAVALYQAFREGLDKKVQCVKGCVTVQSYTKFCEICDAAQNYLDGYLNETPCINEGEEDSASFEQLKTFILQVMEEHSMTNLKEVVAFKNEEVKGAADEENIDDAEPQHSPTSSSLTSQTLQLLCLILWQWLPHQEKNQQHILYRKVDMLHCFLTDDTDDEVVPVHFIEKPSTTSSTCQDEVSLEAVIFSERDENGLQKDAAGLNMLEPMSHLALVDEKNLIANQIVPFLLGLQASGDKWPDEQRKQLDGLRITLNEHTLKGLYDADIFKYTPSDNKEILECTNEQCDAMDRGCHMYRQVYEAHFKPTVALFLRLLKVDAFYKEKEWDYELVDLGLYPQKVTPCASKQAQSDHMERRLKSIFDVKKNLESICQKEVIGHDTAQVIYVSQGLSICLDDHELFMIAMEMGYTLSDREVSAIVCTINL